MIQQTVTIGATEAIINKITTTADGGIRLTLDLDCSTQNISKKLLELKLKGEELIYVGFSYNASGRE